MKGFNETTKDSLASMHKSLADKDGDGISNAVDCVPSDPKKQGALAWVKSKIQKRPYEEVIQEQEEKKEARHSRRLRREERRAEIAQVRAKTHTIRAGTQRSKLSLQSERVKLQEQRRKAAPKMPTMMGSPFGTPSTMPKIDPWNPLGTVPKKKVKSKKRTTKRRKKGKK